MKLYLTLFDDIYYQYIDTGSDTRFDSNLVNILVVNNLVNNLVVHLLFGLQILASDLMADY